MINWKQVSVIMSQEKLCPLGKRITAVNAKLELFCRWVLFYFLFLFVQRTVLNIYLLENRLGLGVMNLLGRARRIFDNFKVTSKLLTEL